MHVMTPLLDATGYRFSDVGANLNDICQKLRQQSVTVMLTRQIVSPFIEVFAEREQA